jgi:hypothetical protein
MPVWTALYRWMAHYPILFLEIALVLLILLGGAGSGFGVPNLFWHEEWLKQLIAGAAVALLFGEISFVGFLLETRAAAAQDQNTDLWQQVRTYLCATWLPLCRPGMPGRAGAALELPGWPGAWHDGDAVARLAVP